MRYEDFNRKMITAHKRIKAGLGPGRFQQTVTNRFPLTLNDASVLSVAEDLGWSPAWLQTRKAKSKAAPPSGDLAAMFKASAPSPVPAAPVQAPSAKATQSMSCCFCSGLFA